MSGDKFDIVLGLMQEFRSDLKEVREEQLKMSMILERNTESLEEHIRRTDLLEAKTEQVDENLARHVQIDSKRFEKLEAPGKARKLLFDWSLKMGAGIGIFYSILQVIEWFKKH